MLLLSFDPGSDLGRVTCSGQWDKSKGDKRSVCTPSLSSLAVPGNLLSLREGAGLVCWLLRTVQPINPSISANNQPTPEAAPRT